MARRTLAVGVLAAAVLLGLVLYLLDFSYWSGYVGVLLRRVGSCAVLALLIVGALLSIDDFPVLPLSVAMLLLPCAALFQRISLFQRNANSDVRARAHGLPRAHR